MKKKSRFPADADRAVRGRRRADRRRDPVAHGTDFVSGAQSGDRAAHLAEDARRRRDDFSRHGRARSAPADCADRGASRSRTATSTASSRPARTSTTICMRRAASITTSARRMPTMRRSPRIGSIASTTRYASEEEFIGNDNWIADFATTLETRPYTTREFLHLLGGHLWNTTGRDGILTAAYRANVPIFCPAIADSSIGMGLSQARQKTSGRRLHRHHRRHRRIGESGHPPAADRVGGARRRHAEELHQSGQRAGRVLQRPGRRPPLRAADRHRRAAFRRRVRLDARGSAKLGQAGGRRRRGSRSRPTPRSRCRFWRARWRRPPRRCSPARKIPVFTLASRVMTIDGQTVPSDRFEDVNEPAV